MNTVTKQIIRKRTAIAIGTLAAGALLALAIAIPVPTLAGNANQDQSAQEMKAPQTAQEHRERAEYYQRKAVEHRKEAEAHKKMLADYGKTVARNPKDTGENVYIKKMRLHCEKYGKAAETLALEADEMAKYHTMRAKEMEGK